MCTKKYQSLVQGVLLKIHCKYTYELVVLQKEKGSLSMDAKKNVRILPVSTLVAISATAILKNKIRFSIESTTFQGKHLERVMIMMIMMMVVVVVLRLEFLQIRVLCCVGLDYGNWDLYGHQ